MTVENSHTRFDCFYSSRVSESGCSEVARPERGRFPVIGSQELTGVRAPNGSKRKPQGLAGVDRAEIQQSAGSQASRRNGARDSGVAPLCRDT
jgi:hypothetical protein